MGVGIRAVILVWGSVVARGIVSTLAEALVASECSERRFRATFEQAPIGMGLFDSVGGIIRLNPVLSNLTGCTGEACILGDLVDEGDAGVAMSSARWAAANPGRRVDIECETRSGDGERRMVSFSMMGIEEIEAGISLPTVLVQAIDITDLRAAEQFMSQRLKVEAVIRSVSTFVVESPVDDLSEATTRSLTMLGEAMGAVRVCLARLSVAALAVEGIDCWSRSDNEESLRGFQAATGLAEATWLDSELRAGRAVTLVRASGDGDPVATRWLESLGTEALLVVPVLLAGGEVGFLAVERDRSVEAWSQDDAGLARVVGELLSHGLRRQADHRALEYLVESKGEFLARVSHELRTPLTVVRGLTEELLESGVPTSREEERELLELIGGHSRELSLLVEDLLVAARIDTGVLYVEPELVNLARVVNLVWSNSRLEDISVVFEIDPDLVVYVDPLRVQQIIRNLLVNAVRHGGTQVRVEASQQAGGIVLAVLDNGLGVPEADAERIFEPYVGVAETQGMPAAIGLGLSVSRLLARLMGGDVAYRRVGDWTCFEVLLQGPE